MGRIDYGAFDKMLGTGQPETAIRNYVKEIEGPLGLMIFNAIDHGLLDDGVMLAIQTTSGSNIEARKMVEEMANHTANTIKSHVTLMPCFLALSIWPRLIPSRDPMTS